VSELLSKPNRGWFPKGRSGNSRGRPANRRVPQDSTFKVLSETIRVIGPDGPRDMLPEEMVEWTTFLAALEGKAMAIRDMAKWLMEYREGLAKDGPEPAPRNIEIVAEQNPTNADEALLLLGIMAPNPAGVTCIPHLLQPWSVQAALSRRRGGSRMTDGERGVVRRLTSDPDSLRWPRGTDR
jgi:uncharacterized protein DUF5681